MENAWYVVYPMHEYDMVQLLGYESHRRAVHRTGHRLSHGASRTRTTPGNATNRPKGFYFNVEIPQKQYELKHPEILETDDDIVTDTLPKLKKNADDLPAQ